MDNMDTLKAEIDEQAKVLKELDEKRQAALQKLQALEQKYQDATGEPAPSKAARDTTDKDKGGKKGKKGKDKKAAAAGAAGKDQPKKDAQGKGKKGKAAGKGKKGSESEGTGKEMFSFPGEEENILKFWNEKDAFQLSMKFSASKPNVEKFVFFDGPPFATGLPHYGHLLAGTIKDVVTRYAHMRGYHVPRRFGWDCHGLPVEYEIDKEYGIKGPDDVMKMGIATYNDACRAIVMRYSEEWRRTVSRLGRWIDFDNDYKTMYPWFMESVWYVFKQIFDKNLVYRGYKVMPFSTALSTPLSNFEASQDMRDVDDPAVTIAFKQVDGDASFLAWTTTPWTLPSNLALCVHPEFEYVKFRDEKRGENFIALKGRLFGPGGLYTEEQKEDVTILESYKGADLKDMRYEPLFPYFADRKDKAFRVLVDTYVTDDSGTGIVHNAPGHGEDDFRVCTAAGVVTTEDLVCPVDHTGKYTKDVPEMEGMYVKDADKVIIKRMKEEGKLFASARIRHAYPHCWRSGTPLLYLTLPSWFIRVTELNEKLLKNNKSTYWVPNNIRDGRFHKWLENARDWAISRNRYWGTPLPLWVSDDGEEVVCVGSIEELQELSGRDDITDLHRQYVDEVTIPSKQGKGVLRRVSEVFDCWFESGSMPYAQQHYPFEHKEDFEQNFPADFIAEGIDQTRGWFYTLLVIGTCLFDKAPWKNLIVNGLVLASDGRKMSKRLKNYPDPNLVLHEDGADALRLYLITSPAVRAENLRFERKGVQGLIREVFLPWLNAFRFFEQQADRLKASSGQPFLFDDTAKCNTDNPTDRWILAFVQELLEFIHAEMQAYRLYTVVPRLLKFVDNLTNWYVRLNRKRLKGAEGDEDAAIALWALGEVLMTMAKFMAPFTPFFAEWMYQHMKPYIKVSPEAEAQLRTIDGVREDESVHFNLVPDPKPFYEDHSVVRAFEVLKRTIDGGRVLRERNKMPVKYPAMELVVVSTTENVLEDLQSLQTYVTSELNIRKLTLSSDESAYKVKLKAQPDFKTLGSRLKSDIKKVAAAVRQLTHDQLTEYQSTQTIELCGHTLTGTDLVLSYEYAGDDNKYAAQADGDILVLLDVLEYPELVDEGIAREVVSRVQKMRQAAGLSPTDPITVTHKLQGGKKTDDLERVLGSHQSYIAEALSCTFQPASDEADASAVIATEALKIKGASLQVTIFKA
ncbi:isoleucyl-tRNA synthetase [Salpingoeca rosetta]|uniref:isoleucine--tRNA ligase n=1 Tax=Salpingoeca rosetta (strain ATCC 50818 / BSB-021) TaxID=946362 RepID=F2UBS1_SALR5|nr:isoleucyl-tRNA synthetase [Salpingoeca rosetta]EGD73937.1 isoleucyl-tRNA synthetase [Salpingoeca rosetta]|eukprot:XP_004993500.1 isoleucyl-tRNA synthetase [Salpingoeca rosetta]